MIGDGTNARKERTMVGYGSETQGALYSSARSRGRRNRIWSKLTGRSCNLLSLADVDAACTVCSRRHAGLRTVPISHIRGSEGRCNDFDAEFNPLQSHTAGRWRSVAKARLEGKALPPVELVQVGDVYFVRDGHHRISVARASGQLDIEAEVMAWQVTGPLPWEASAGTARKESAVKRLTGTVRARSAGLRDRLLPSLGGLMIARGTRLRARLVSQASTGGAS
jgi:hypothetical protein